MEIFLLWFVLCFIVALVGENRKIGYWGVFFISLILSPLIGLIVGLVSDKKVTEPQSQAQQQRQEPMSSVSITEELTKLKQLHDAGAISEQEYTTAKEKLLKRI
jgi:uncharacterized membrane protein